MVEDSALAEPSTMAVPLEATEEESRFSRSDLRDAIVALGGEVGDFEGLIVKKNANGYLRRIYGEGFSLPLPDLEQGVQGEDALGSRVQSLLPMLDLFVGRFDGDSSLAHVRTTVTKRGSAIVRLKHHYQDVEVLSAEIIVMINPEERVISIISTAAPELRIKPGTMTPDLADVFRGSCNECILQTIESEVKESYEINLKKNVLVLDAQRKVASPAVYVSISTNSGEQYLLLANPSDGSTMSFKRVTAESDAPQEIYVGQDYFSYTTTQCPNGDSDCSYFHQCAEDTEYNDQPICVSDCDSLSLCHLIGWGCNSKNGKCNRPVMTIDDSLLVYDNVDQGGWVVPGREYNLHFEGIRAVTENLYQFHKNILGRDSWDDDNGTYKTVQVIDGSGGRGAGGNVYLPFYDAYLNYGDDEQSDLDQIVCQGLPAHEWGHNIDESITNANCPKASCVGENFAQMNDTLFNVYMIGGSEVQTHPTYRCERSAWTDDTMGLSGNACRTNMYLPYGHRSSFDWNECPPRKGDYQTVWTTTTCNDLAECRPYYSCKDGLCALTGNTHNNKEIWRRFLRLLDEGSSTFSVDGNSEDIGVSFSGLEIQGTVDVFYEAALSRFESMNLDDWVDSLITAGISQEHSLEVKKSLGAVGFITDTYTSNTMETDRAPYKYYFSAWGYLLSKYFYVYRQEYSYDIKVVYWDIYGGHTITIPANTYHAPAVTEYNDRLYIFWRDRSDGAIKFKYIRYDGTQYGPYDLGGKGLYTGGSFDVVEYQNSLYVVYSESGTLKTKIAKCTTSWCNSSGWHDFDSGSGVDYTKYLGYYSYPGMGIDHGTGLDRHNVFEDLLYIVSASAYPDPFRIRLDAIDPYDERTHTNENVMLDCNFPSCMTASEIGVKMVRSAFPTYESIWFNPPRNYLYFSWKGAPYDSKIYKSIVQSYNRQKPENTVITKAHDTFLSSSRGVRIMKGQGEEMDKVQYVTVDSTGKIRYSYLYGRY
ncbi:MAG: hypothetical protein JRF33_25840 [Deltaproteobacteria bacterium]|nr:hypothetical protein [Deltaproteobacteria bacterium]